MIICLNRYYSLELGRQNLAHRECVFNIEIFYVHGSVEELTEGTAAGDCKGKAFPVHSMQA